ncbi:unnamed protein product [Protopolystoma xenopodis]|uniref:Uncharacterized protein n=1 Tax=Protopolystoma xenopodis TaxID=117903 RepID=A0A3S5A3T2_9PLAT|nr:unnamed protein product [Protopolystoma xenopodis]
MLACSKCGGLVHAGFNRSVNPVSLAFTTPLSDASAGTWACRLCTSIEANNVDLGSEAAKTSQLQSVQVSAAFRYLTYELACLGIQTRLGVSQLA